MTGAEMIAVERQRQVDSEGWTAEHDDEHDDGEMALAAACYARMAHIPDDLRRPDDKDTPEHWPWEWDEWKPKSQLRDLARAGALIAAEIDRLQRAAKDGGGDE